MFFCAVLHFYKTTALMTRARNMPLIYGCSNTIKIAARELSKDGVVFCDDGFVKNLDKICARTNNYSVIQVAD